MFWIGFGNMNLCIWCQWKPFEHEWERKGWESTTEKVCFSSVFMWWFLDRTSKTQQNNKTACSVCIISHTNTHTQRLYAHNPSAHTWENYTNTANHSSIFYARMHHTSAPLCKLQLMCREKRSELRRAENTKVEGVSGSRGRWGRQEERGKWERYKKRWTERKREMLRDQKFRFLQDITFFPFVLL